MRVRSLINRVSADPSFFRNMTAMENLMFFGRVYGLTPRRDQGARRRRSCGGSGFEWERALEPMSHLSRGQQQKVAVARSFLTSPSLMLLDEPTTGLDPRSKRDVQALRPRGAARPRRDDPADDARHGGGGAALRPHRLHLAAAASSPKARRWSCGRRSRTGGRVESINMEDVFMELTGRELEEDEEAGCEGEAAAQIPSR